MRVIGLSQQSIDTVLRLVACVLHLGNISFANTSADEATVADARAKYAMQAAAALLGVSWAGDCAWWCLHWGKWCGQGMKSLLSWLCLPSSACLHG